MTHNRTRELEKYFVPGTHVHLVGIGGVSMRPLGLVLKGMGVDVTAVPLQYSADCHSFGSFLQWPH